MMEGLFMAVPLIVMIAFWAFMIWAILAIIEALNGIRRELRLIAANLSRE
jgi:hypothetical protein